jgi:hypothetical protein
MQQAGRRIAHAQAAPGAAPRAPPRALPSPHYRCRRRRRSTLAPHASAYTEPEPVELYRGRSEHSPDIRVIEIPDTRAYPNQIRGGRVLYLDDSPNIHSVWHPPEQGGRGRGSSSAAAVRATGAYFDVLATLPAFLNSPPTPPKAPIVILGLGAGTVARLMDGAYRGWFSQGGGDGGGAQAPPQQQSPLLVGVELDGAVIDVAREHMGLAPLLDGGTLAVRVGDALADPPEEEVGACAGVIVDLFSNGRLLPALKEADTWRRILGKRLIADSGARAIVNLGAGPVPNMPVTPPIADALEALAAMEEALGEHAGGPGVCAAALRSRTTSNLVAMTGGVPTREEVNAAASLLDDLDAPTELRAAAAQTAWQDSSVFSMAAAAGMGGGGRAALPGMGPGGRRAHYGGGPGMGGGPSGGRMRF